MFGKPGSPTADERADEVGRRARAIRRHVVAQARGKGEGYVGQGLQCAELMAALLFTELRWRSDLHGDERDRFLLSVGHYAIGHYAALAEAGVISVEDLGSYGADGSPLTMGTEPGAVPGVEVAGGSLGQGLGVAAGVAWGLRHQGVRARVACYLSDGELQEGSTWEAAMLAGHQGLDRLLAVVDINRTQADGALVVEVEPVVGKLEAFGWWATELDGNDPVAVVEALDRARRVTGVPQALVCHTRLGAGSPTVAERPGGHFVRVRDEEWDRVAADVEGYP